MQSHSRCLVDLALHLSCVVLIILKMAHAQNPPHPAFQRPEYLRLDIARQFLQYLPAALTRFSRHDDDSEELRRHVPHLLAAAEHKILQVQNRGVRKLKSYSLPGGGSYYCGQDLAFIGLALMKRDSPVNADGTWGEDRYQKGSGHTHSGVEYSSQQMPHPSERTRAVNICPCFQPNQESVLGGR